METPKRLTRSSTDKKVAGVCGGIAEYFNIDSTLVRLIFVLATLLGGPGLILYIVLWIVMPEA
jgi:phage shock protein PspC (stress-responsive transcriptional regulator)